MKCAGLYTSSPNPPPPPLFSFIHLGLDTRPKPSTLNQAYPPAPHPRARAPPACSVMGREKRWLLYSLLTELNLEFDQPRQKRV